jgi:uncharacterized phage protein gp47/JayE
MAGLTVNGLVIKRLPDIIEELEAALKLQYGNGLDVSENSLFGILNTIIAAAIAEQWELAQSLYDAFIIDVAEGKSLDDLAAILKITRLAPTKSFGDLDLFGTSGTVVPIGTQFSDLNGNEYLSTEQGTLSTGTSRTPVSIRPQGGVGVPDDPSTTFAITINGDLYSYQTVWPPSLQNIAETLQGLVPSDKDYYIETIYDGNPEFINDPISYFEPLLGFNLNAASTLNVINKDEINPITVTVQITNSPTASHEANNTPFMGVATKVATFTDTVKVEATTTGERFTSSNSLTTIDTPVTGLDTVNNPADIISGRDLESDEELRARFKTSSSINGNATVPSIEAKLNQVEGVSQAFVIENRSINVDAQGREGKSYECLVVGGTDEAIAQVIWESKPAGVELVGTESVTITDDQGKFRSVKFSRPTSIYVWVKAYYTKYSEEAFPTNGEDLMEDSIVSYGSTLDLGEDVIPKRFYGGIYSSVSGIQDLRVLVATSVDPLIEPNIANFKEQVITISDNEIATFTEDRTEIIEE